MRTLRSFEKNGLPTLAGLHHAVQPCRRKILNNGYHAGEKFWTVVPCKREILNSAYHAREKFWTVPSPTMKVINSEQCLVILWKWEILNSAYIESEKFWTVPFLKVRNSEQCLLCKCEILNSAYHTRESVWPKSPSISAGADCLSSLREAELLTAPGQAGLKTRKGDLDY